MNGPCPDRQDRIVDYMLGALEEPQSRAVREHLDACEGCREYMEAIRDRSDALIGLGERVAAGMDARRDRVIQALEQVAPAELGGTKIVPLFGRLMRIAAAAVLVLGAGILIGRMTVPEPMDAEQLRADLEASIVASLKPAIQEGVLAGLEERLQAALTTNDTKLRIEVAEQISRDLRQFAAQFTSNSEQLMDRRFAELIEVIEAARLTDRRQVARALEQIKAQTGAGLRRVLTENASVTVEN